MCLQIVSESLTSIVMVKIYCSEMFRTWTKIRCLFQDRFVKTFLFIIPSLSRPGITNISCFGETTKKFNIHPYIWIWHWTSIQLYQIPRSITNYIFKIWKIIRLQYVYNYYTNIVWKPCLIKGLKIILLILLHTDSKYYLCYVSWQRI